MFIYVVFNFYFLLWEVARMEGGYERDGKMSGIGVHKESILFFF